MLPEWTVDFLAALAACPNVSDAARRAGVARQRAYELRAAEPDFARRWDEALDESTDDLVGECYRRAREGVERPIFHKGDRVGAERVYSDTLAIFLLKAHRRPVYGDKVQADLSGGLSIRVEYADPDPDAAEAPPGPAADPA